MLLEAIVNISLWWSHSVLHLPTLAFMVMATTGHRIALSKAPIPEVTMLETSTVVPRDINKLSKDANRVLRITFLTLPLVGQGISGYSSLVCLSVLLYYVNRNRIFHWSFCNKLIPGGLLPTDVSWCCCLFPSPSPSFFRVPSSSFSPSFFPLLLPLSLPLLLFFPPPSLHPLPPSSCLITIVTIIIIFLSNSVLARSFLFLNSW